MDVEVSNYIAQLPTEKKEVIEMLRNVISENIPSGFKECLSYKMIGYVVPHDLYPKGYHCSPELPLPFINIAAQKNFYAIYHMGIYASPSLLTWFQSAYENLNIGKLDMGKSCIRFKKPEMIPYSLIAELASKVSVDEWILLYEKSFNK